MLEIWDMGCSTWWDGATERQIQGFLIIDLAVITFLNNEFQLLKIQIIYVED